MAAISKLQNGLATPVTAKAVNCGYPVFDMDSIILTLDKALPAGTLSSLPMAAVNGRVYWIAIKHCSRRYYSWFRSPLHSTIFDSITPLHIAPKHCSLFWRSNSLQHYCCQTRMILKFQVVWRYRYCECRCSLPTDKFKQNYYCAAAAPISKRAISYCFKNGTDASLSCSLMSVADCCLNTLCFRGYDTVLQIFITHCIKAARLILFAPLPRWRQQCKQMAVDV